MLSSRLLLLFLLAALLVVARADFDRDDLDDSSFTLRKGESNICPSKVKIDDDDTLNIPADQIELQDVKCKGSGTLKLESFSSSSQSAKPAVKYFISNSQIGRFLAGAVSQQLECGSYQLSKAKTLIFLEPEDDVSQVKWSAIFKNDSAPLASKGDDDVDFKEDRRYLIIADECFYSSTNIIDRVKCFPADATVLVENGAIRRMDQLAVGDRVHVGNGVFSDVIAWTHKSSNVASSFVSLTAESGHKLVATRGHFVYADGRPIPAKDVRVGMALRLATGAMTRVVKVDKIAGRGLYNPQTSHGDIAVNGLVATTYTTAIKPQAAHALLAPVRAAFSALRPFLAVSQDSEL